jgi:hypothetical protein
MKSHRFLALASSFLILGATRANAQPDHAGDIILAVDNGRIVTGAEDAVGAFIPARVFAAEFGNLGENITDEPGFDCEAGTFPLGTTNSFRILRAVRTWDGAAFAQIPAERIAVTRSTFNPPPPVFSPLTDDPIAGFGIAVAADGRWHYHLEYNLLAPAAEGIYLLELDLASSSNDLDRSRPFWLVLNKLRPEPEHDAAVEWTQYALAREGCPADFNRDRGVNSADISAFLTAWLAEIASGPGAADIDGDGVVNSLDISLYLTAWRSGVGGGC